MPKILITDKTSESGLKLLEKLNVDYDYVPGIEHDKLLEIIDKYDAILVRGRTKVTKDVIEQGKKLRVIGRIGVGLDNIDVKFAKERGITVINAGDATADSVAELTIGLMISLVRKINLGDLSFKKGIFAKNECKGIELHGKKLGIIGVGNIGSRVAKIALAMGMVVLGYDVYPERIRKSGLEIQITPYEDVLKNSDIITVHVPLLPQTRHMISKKEISMMKRGVFLINAARVEIFDLSAIIWGLENGIIAGVALDSNKKPDDPLMKKLAEFPNTVITPHIGAQTEAAQEKAVKKVILDVVTILKSS
ncbi:MAG: NAD(P)-dependent oxidoreductase [Candidatus Njordarchaeia archaeon]|nr:NAD(P)-binding domain-containing protein [Candidatus Korarchaeota archaeon]